MTADEIRELVAGAKGAATRLRDETGQDYFSAIRAVKAIDHEIILAEIAAQLAELNAKLLDITSPESDYTYGHIRTKAIE
jgi:hypothetical protein